MHLARVLKSAGNVLLLDEPTNDLDVDTLRALEDGLEAGTHQFVVEADGLQPARCTAVVRAGELTVVPVPMVPR